jgi:hypothetical protein
MLLENDPRVTETCTLGVIPQHSTLLGAITKFLLYIYIYIYDDMQNCKIYLQLSLFGPKQTGVLSPLHYNLTPQYTSKNVKA